MKISTATIHDLNTLVSMRIEFIKQLHPSLTEAEVSALQKQLPAYYKKHLGQDFFAYFAAEGDEVVSTAYLVVSERPANHHMATGKFGLILNVYTKPAFRKRGLASALVQKVMKEAEKHNLSYVELQATESGEPVYAKLGFEPIQPVYTCMEYRFDAPGDNSTGNP